MPFQDDERETEIIALFGLQKPVGATRGGMDAELLLEGSLIPFEVKSSSKSSVTTVRDLGMDHIRKWRGKHWLFGFYIQAELSFSLYGSPSAMVGWIAKKAQYIATDVALAKKVPPLVTAETLAQVLNKSSGFTVEDAKKLHKLQFSAEEYRSLGDKDGSVTDAKMLDVLRHRTGYLIERGSTLNNPHIPGSYFNGWPKITSNHAAELRRLVQAALKQEQPPPI